VSQQAGQKPVPETPAKSAPIPDLKWILIETFTSWIDHRASSKGAALAFYTLFSMMPILILV
jgi:uncharacterized BrkB/YihY/UPF0761 family membrane protein